MKNFIKIVMAVMVVIAVFFVVGCAAQTEPTQTEVVTPTIEVKASDVENKVEVNVEPTPVTIENKVDTPAVLNTVEVNVPEVAFTSYSVNGKTVKGDGWRVVNFEDSIFVTITYSTPKLNPSYQSEELTPYEAKYVSDVEVGTKVFKIDVTYEVLVVDGLSAFEPRTAIDDFEAESLNVNYRIYEGKICVNKTPITTLDSKVVREWSEFNSDYTILAITEVVD